MEIIIRETGERKQLNRIHPKSDYDAAVDTLNAYGALDDGQFDDGQFDDGLDGELVCSQETFSRWQVVFEMFSEVDRRILALTDEYGSAAVDIALQAIALAPGKPVDNTIELSLALDRAFGAESEHTSRLMGALCKYPLDADFTHWDLRGAGGHTVAHIAALNKALPEGFDAWTMTDDEGNTVAHFAAQAGPLPCEFDLWEMPDKGNFERTVAHVAAEAGTLPADFDKWDLVDGVGRTVRQVAKRSGHYPATAGTLDTKCETKTKGPKL